MIPLTKKEVRQLNLSWHRDLGYFFSTLIVVYCLSGIALNHVNDWNPDFVLDKKEIQVPQNYRVAEIDKEKVKELSLLVGEEGYKMFDFPTSDQVKIYYEDASLHVNLANKSGVYERVSKRPLFYQSNVLHRNNLKGWKWASDIFAFLLIAITVTGIFIAKGKYGISRRGKWLMLAGFLPILVAILIQSYT
ncbi:MAG TPA: hypothetical protein DIW47_05270 [Bacteroidetes bacterium]|nr:hypothetical protein [Bacteroidota bacterium]